MIWPFLLAFGLLALWGSYRASDDRGQWVAGLWVLGVIAMQIPMAEPGRWLFASVLWTVVPLIIGLRARAAKAALVMALIPLGYWGLAADGYGLLLLGGAGRNVAFGVTELAGVIGVLIGCQEAMRNVLDRLRSWRRSLGSGRRLVIPASPDRGNRPRRFRFNGRVGR